MAIYQGRDTGIHILLILREKKNTPYIQADMLNFSAPEPFPNPKTLSQLSRPRSEAIFAIPPTYPGSPRNRPVLPTRYNTNIGPADRLRLENGPNTATARTNPGSSVRWQNPEPVRAGRPTGKLTLVDRRLTLDTAPEAHRRN